MASEGDLVFVGDVHLAADDPALADFLHFLAGLATTAARVVLLGDLFDVWIGDRRLEGPHQRAVAVRLAELRRSGVVVRYIEGNRDYRVGHAYAGTALDDVTEGGLVERFGGRSLFAIHGDLANPDDRLYRAWRLLSRSAAVWAVLSRLPAPLARGIADRAEARLRRANRAYKGAFPEHVVRRYAAPLLEAGHDAIVLGHFHVERELEVASGAGARRVLVLPEWRGSRRHLRVTTEGEIGFVDSPS